MKEYQFKLENVWIDVNASHAEEAVRILNDELHQLDNPISIGGGIQRVYLEITRNVTREDITQIYDSMRGSLRQVKRLSQPVGLVS